MQYKKAGRDTWEQKIVGEIYEKLDSPLVKGELNPQMIVDVIVGGSLDGSQESWLELPADQGYEATCVPASIEE